MFIMVQQQEEEEEEEIEEDMKSTMRSMNLYVINPSKYSVSNSFNTSNRHEINLSIFHQNMQCVHQNLKLRITSKISLRRLFVYLNIS